MKGPLEGITVIDFSAVVSGPLAAMWLADQGAEVIKVETLGAGDVTRGTRASPENEQAKHRQTMPEEATPKELPLRTGNCR